jgi:hypothetical protein
MFKKKVRYNFEKKKILENLTYRLVIKKLNERDELTLEEDCNYKYNNFFFYSV